MARLGIAKDFLSDYAKLEKPVRKKVDEAIGRFTQHTHAGLHLEKIASSRDPRIRTIKISAFYRGLVLAPDTGDDYLLICVKPHDDANAYAATHRFSVNQTLGVLEVRNQQALEGIEPALRQAAEDSTTPLLFAHVKDSQLVTLGVDAEVLPLVRLLTTDAHLDALQNLLPEPQYDALVALASGMSVEAAWVEVSRHLVAEAPAAPVDPDDLSAAIQRTPGRFTLVSGPAELAQVLAHPFDAWRIFLHPTQRKIVDRESYAGPTLVTGGAGTGKTVTALHRAAHLARRVEPAEAPPVLLTTFTRTLAEALDDQLARLVDDPTLRSRIEVVNVDRLAHRVVAEAHGHNPGIVAPDELRQMWADAARTQGNDFNPVFLEREWEQVVLAQRITDLAGYLAARRHGRGAPLARRQRRRVWEAIGAVTARLRHTKQRTHLQLADDAARLLAERSVGPYRHVIVDEGQDLHPAQWRLLRAAAVPGPDDLFIVADPHQRIYDNRVSLDSLGIGVRGRSRKLTISYRTTQEILTWAVRVLDGLPQDGLDDERDELTGYRSPMHGRRPNVRAYPDRDAELDGLVEQLASWLGSGVEPHSIGVAARNSFLLGGKQGTGGVLAALAAAGLPATSTAARKKNAIRVGTMHSMKGLEFRCVAVIGVDDGTIPAPRAVTPLADDPVAHAHDTQRERCLLFVACTRARDFLYVSHTGHPSELLPKPAP